MNQKDVVKNLNGEVDMYKWNVMYLCERQLRDVNPDDILCNGLYRKCNTYKGGGGYDQFPAIFVQKTGRTGDFHNQFVAQLQGCPLWCPYCYVTRDGVQHGTCAIVPTDTLIRDFLSSGLQVFHLMGGAPALYIDHWVDILKALPADKVFHSDLLLVEGEYSEDVILELSKYDNALYAVSIKGSTPEEFYANTGVCWKQELFWKNFDTIVECKLPFYLTYTGMSAESIENFNNMVLERYNDQTLLQYSFPIQLVKYKALD